MHTEYHDLNSQFRLLYRAKLWQFLQLHLARHNLESKRKYFYIYPANILHQIPELHPQQHPKPRKTDFHKTVYTLHQSVQFRYQLFPVKLNHQPVFGVQYLSFQDLKYTKEQKRLFHLFQEYSRKKMEPEYQNPYKDSQ